MFLELMCSLLTHVCMYVASCKYYESRDTRAFIYGENEEDCYFVSAAAKQDLKTLDYSFNQQES